MQTMEDTLEHEFGAIRFPMMVGWIFTAFALALVAIGISGVIGYSVSQRIHEIAVRMALGARRTDVLWLVLWEGLMITLIGVLAGAGTALAASRVVTSYLYGTSPYDLVAYICAGTILVAVALLSAYVPARRATKVDPIMALRYE